MNKQDQSQNNSNDSINSTGKARSGRGRRWILAGVAAVAVGVMSIAGISYAEENGGFHCRHGGFGNHRPLTVEAMNQHFDGVIKRILPNGTADQKTKLAAIAKAAFADLKPLHTQHQAARQAAVKILTQATIDRAALEQLRAGEMQLADQLSKRIVQAVADAAEVLTPEQRLKFAEHFAARFGTQADPSVQKSPF